MRQFGILFMFTKTSIFHLRNSHTHGARFLWHHKSYRITPNDFVLKSGIAEKKKKNCTQVYWEIKAKSILAPRKRRSPHICGEHLVLQSSCRWFGWFTLHGISLTYVLFVLSSDFAAPRHQFPMAMAWACNFNKMSIYLFFASAATLKRLAGPIPVQLKCCDEITAISVRHTEKDTKMENR